MLVGLPQRLLVQGKKAKNNHLQTFLRVFSAFAQDY